MLKELIFAHQLKRNSQMVNKRELENGDTVLAGYQRHRMIVVGATECLKGWKYRLAFPKKDGTPNKRKIHLHFFIEDLTKQPNERLETDFRRITKPK